jgi:hypothetical protein
MAAFVAGDVVVSITEMIRIGKKKKHFGTMTLGGGPTYPTSGIPLPPVANFGFVSQIDSLHVFGVNALTAEYQYRYSKAAHKLLVYENAATTGPFPEADIAEAPAARVLNWEAWGV